MYYVPLRLDATSVHRADWVEIQLAGRGVPRLSIDELTDDLREDPADLSEDEEKSGDEGRWSRARHLAEEAFGELRWRSDWLGDRYPIRFEDVEVVAWTDDSPTIVTYSFLVLLRAKQILGGSMNGGPHDPGFLFEELTTQATGAYVAAQAVRFGDAGGKRGSGLPINFSEAIAELARRMGEEPGDGVGSGDERADVIAWRPFGDRRAGQLVMITQATIAEGEWQMKQIRSKWEDGRLIQFVAKPLPAVGFVESMSLYSTDVFRGTDFRSVPFDRLRIVSLLTDEGIDSDLLDSMGEWTEWAITRLPE